MNATRRKRFERIVMCYVVATGGRPELVPALDLLSAVREVIPDVSESEHAMCVYEIPLPEELRSSDLMVLAR